MKLMTSGTMAHVVQCAIVALSKKWFQRKAFSFEFSCKNDESKLMIGKAFQRAGSLWK